MSLKGRKQTFKVARGEDGETNLEEYEITLDEGMVVLDCMHRIQHEHCLLYTSPSPRDLSTSRMPSSA